MPKGIFSNPQIRNNRISLTKRTDNFKIKDIVVCRSCYCSFRPKRGRIRENCPDCGKELDVRNRKKQYQKRSRATLLKWIKNNPKKIKISRDNHRKKLRIGVLKKITNYKKIVCIACGCNDIRLLEINHKNGGGTKENKRIGSMRLYYDILYEKRTVKDLEILCRVCNSLHYLELKFGKLPFKIIWK